MKKNFGFTTDGEFLYIHCKGLGLMKIGTGENNKMLGKVYAHKNFYRQDEKCKLLYLNGKLLCRSKNDTSKPIFIIDCETMEETKESLVVNKEIPNIEYKDDKENNRFMNITPLFTDSNYLYAISYKKPEKEDDEEEEEKDEGNRGQQSSN